jgi:hypothetical protein
MDLFLYAVRYKDNRHRFPALYAIQGLDKKRFDELLLATIESIPRDVDVPYWTCPEAHIAALATTCDDPRIWPMLEEVAKRSSVGLRMELPNRLHKGGEIVVGRNGFAFWPLFSMTTRRGLGIPRNSTDLVPASSTMN